MFRFRQEIAVTNKLIALYYQHLSKVSPDAYQGDNGDCEVRSGARGFVRGTLLSFFRFCALCWFDGVMMLTWLWFQAKICRLKMELSTSKDLEKSYVDLAMVSSFCLLLNLVPGKAFIFCSIEYSVPGKAFIHLKLLFVSCYHIFCMRYPPPLLKIIVLGLVLSLSIADVKSYVLRRFESRQVCVAYLGDLLK